MIQRLKFVAAHAAYRFFTPLRCSAVITFAAVAAIGVLFAGMSASETTHGLNMAGAGQGMAIGLVVLIAIPLLLGWYIYRKVGSVRLRWAQRNGDGPR